MKLLNRLFVSKGRKKLLSILNQINQELNDRVPENTLGESWAWKTAIYLPFINEIKTSNDHRYNKLITSETLIENLCLIIIDRINSELTTGRFHAWRGLLSTEGEYLRRVSHYLFKNKLSPYFKQQGKSDEDLENIRDNIFRDTDYWIKHMG